MRLTCTNLTCQTVLNYSEPVILGLFINGVKDMELQQDFLAEQNMTLPKAVTQAVARETAKRSQGILDTSQQVVTGISTYKKCLNKVLVPPDYCGNCGNKRQSERKDCPAKDNVCNCGIKGHYRKYCYRDGKKRNPQSGGGKKTTKTDEADSKEETSHGVDENFFSLQTEVQTNRGPGISTDPLKSLHTMPTVDQPKEVIMASLQYSEGNNSWRCSASSPSLCMW